MTLHDISVLRNAVVSYKGLLSRIEYYSNVSDDGRVSQMHQAIANVYLDEIGNVLGQCNVHEYRIIEDTVRPTLAVIDGLCKVIGKNLPKLMVCNIDPNVGEVFKFCQRAKEVLEREYENLTSRRNTDPTFDDVDAVEKLREFGLGSYGDIAFDDFIKEYIIKGLSHIAVVRRLKHMISQCANEQTKRDLSKFIYWRKCDEDAIGELDSAFGDLIKFYDHAADVSPIPSDGNRDDVTTRMFSVLEWCKQHDNEFKTQLVNRPLLKDVEDLGVLATYICESADKWCSVIGGEAVTLQLFNDVAMILDNAIAPTIKQRNPTPTPSQPTPEAQPSPSVVATAECGVALPDFSHMESYTPTIEFDMSALYSFLIDEGVIHDIDVDLFSNCITHAHINEIWDCKYTINCRKRNLLQSLFKMVAEYYPDKWIEACAANLNVVKKQITNPTRSSATMELEDKLRNILKGKSIK